MLNTEQKKEINLLIDELNNIKEQNAADIEQSADDLKNTILSFDNVTSYNNIYVVACLGLWSGKRTATGLFKSLYDAVFNSRALEDQNTFYFKSKKSTLTLKAVHHDGTNFFKFYKVVNGKKYAINFNALEAL